MGLFYLKQKHCLIFLKNALYEFMDSKFMMLKYFISLYTKTPCDGMSMEFTYSRKNIRLKIRRMRI